MLSFVFQNTYRFDVRKECFIDLIHRREMLKCLDEDVDLHNLGEIGTCSVKDRFKVL